MHIGIITICRCNNYGAELQAFALQRKLSIMGYDAEIIDYLFYKHPRHTKEFVSMPSYKGYPIAKRIKEILYPIIERVRSLKYSREAGIKRNHRFDAFHNQNTHFSRQYTRMSDLYNNVPQYDVYCVGSDQVWNPWSYTSLDPYFLTFAPKNSVKFAYASSFGVSEIPPVAREYFKKGLSNIGPIAVRESTGASIVESLTGRVTQTVADPTLLLTSNEWNEVLNEEFVPKEKYILIYELKDAPNIAETAQRIAKKKGLVVVRITKGAFRQDTKESGIVNVMDAGPAEFLGLFKNAEMILTNSFHGTVFSIIFNRDFYTLVNRGVNNNSRQTDLLRMLDVDRIRYTDENFNEAEPIDWNKVNRNVESFRQVSVEYIKQAIL